MLVFTYLYIAENFLKKFLKGYSQIGFRQKTSQLESVLLSVFSSCLHQLFALVSPDNKANLYRSDNEETNTTEKTRRRISLNKTSGN